LRDTSALFWHIALERRPAEAPAHDRAMLDAAAARSFSPRGQQMAVTQSQVLDQLRRIKGPDLEGNIVDLGLVSEILLRDDKVYFTITVPPDRAASLEPLRQAAEKVVKDIPGVQGVTAVLTAETPRGSSGNSGAAPRADSARV